MWHTYSSGSLIFLLIIVDLIAYRHLLCNAETNWAKWQIDCYMD